MPYQKRVQSPDYQQYHRIRFDNLAALYREGVHYECRQADRGVQMCLHALAELPVAVHVESFATDKFHCVSHAFARMHGYEAVELEGAVLMDFCAPQGRVQAERQRSLALLTGEAVYSSEHESREGTLFPVRVSLRLLRHEEENVGLLATLHAQKADRTEVAPFEAERARYEQAFDKLKVEAEEARNKMIANTHLTRRHLEVAAGWAEMWQNPHEFWLTLTPTEVRSMGREMEELAEVYAHLHTSQAAGDFSHKVPLRPLLLKRLEEWRTAYLERPFAADIADLAIHVRQLLSLCVALKAVVQNAFQHGRGQVLVVAVEEEGWLRVCVEDEGPGFPTDFVPRTGWGEVGSENTQGLGIVSATQWGLSPIQGEIRYENAPGGGARVVIAFPLFELDNH